VRDADPQQPPVNPQNRYKPHIRYIPTKRKTGDFADNSLDILRQVGYTDGFKDGGEKAS